jgi:hypothetical protein
MLFHLPLKILLKLVFGLFEAAFFAILGLPQTQNPPIQSSQVLGL